MKHIGLIGGLSPESTVSYYQLLCRRFNERAGGLRFPTLTLRSLDLQQMVELFAADRWNEVATRLVAAIGDLHAAGAELVAIAANTPHHAYEQVVARSVLPVVGIMDATARAIREKGVSTVGLLGTRATMEYGFFQRAFGRQQIETLVPAHDERAALDRIIWDELSHGQIHERSRERLLGWIDALVRAGADGIVLGCTELPLLVRPEQVAVPCFDTTALHAMAILDVAMADSPA